MNKRKIRLCIIMGGHFSATIGGAQYQAKCIVENIVETGEFDVFYLARHVNPLFHAVGYQIIKISNNKKLKQNSLFFDVLKIKKWLEKIKPDVIYQRGLKSYTGIAAYYAKRNHCRMVFHIASEVDVSPFRWNGGLHDIARLIEKKVGEYGLRYSDSVIAQTEYQANLLLNNYGIKVTSVIKNFHPLSQENISKSEPIKIIWVANFKPIKRPEIFVKLARDMRYIDSVEFHMVGRQGDKRLYSELHKEIKDIKNMCYHGELPIEEVNKLLAESDIFVNTSELEGFPNTFIQAWMRKVPIVSLNVDPDDILKIYKIGFCSKSYEVLRNDVTRLIQDSTLRINMGDRAYDYAINSHSIDNVKNLIAILKVNNS